MYILTKTKEIEGVKPKKGHSKGYKPNTDYNSLIARYFKHIMESTDKYSDLTIEKQNDIYVATLKKRNFGFNIHEKLDISDLSGISKIFNELQREKNENEFNRSYKESKMQHNYLYNIDIERFILLYATRKYQRVLKDDFDHVLLKGMHKDLLDYGKTKAIQTPPNPEAQLQYKLAELFKYNLGLIDVGVRRIIKARHVTMTNLLRFVNSDDPKDDGTFTATDFEVELDYQFYYSFNNLSAAWSK